MIVSIAYSLFLKGLARMRDTVIGHIVKAFLKPIKHGWGREPKSFRTLGIAGIHATILTILIGITSAYYIFAREKIYEMEMQALREAEKINQVQFVRAYYWPNADDFSTYSDPKANLSLLLWTLFSDRTKSQNLTPKMAIPKMPADRAEKALQIMNFLVHRYPFPESIVSSSGSVSFNPPKPLLFTDRAAIVKWSEDLERVVDNMSMWPRVLAKDVDEYLQALKSRNKELIEQWKTDHILQVMGLIDPYVVYNDYIQNFGRAYEINQSVKFYLNKLAWVERRLAPKKEMWTGIGLVFLAFFCGVILPLFRDRVRRVFLLWIPCGFYIFVFLFLVYRAFL